MFADYIQPLRNQNLPQRPYESRQKLENIAGLAAGGGLNLLLALPFIPIT